MFNLSSINETVSSIRSVDIDMFLRELAKWQRSEPRLTYILDSVYDVFFDCCEFEEEGDWASLVTK